MKLSKKSEWFELESPIGEPTLKWEKERWNRGYTNKEPNTYLIERIERENGEVVWFGQSVNWKRENEKWFVLGVDENVKPTFFIKGENGMGDYAEYPEGRIIWIECDVPIYEKLYKQINKL